MLNEKYWEKRVIELENAMHDLNEEAYKKVESTFLDAQKDLNHQIDYWLRRMANNEGVSLQEARRLLSTKELEELKWDVYEYMQKVEESVGTQKWAKELENASAKAHISRLEGLQIQLQHIIEKSFAKELAEMTALAMTVYEESYLRGLFGIETELGTHFDVSGIDENKLKKVISKPWVADGRNFSDRIWTNKNQMVDELHKALMRTLITGETSDKAVKQLEKYVDHSMGKAKNRAAALFQTEEAYFSSCALRELYDELGVEHFKIIATLDTKTSAICREMDRKEFPLDDWEIGVTAPPFHVRCRSSFGGSFGDDLVKSTRAARDENGKTIHVPNDMTYDEWYEKYGKEIQRKADEKAQRKKAKRKENKKKDLQISENDGSIENNLGDEEMKAISDYTSSESYFINEALRNRQPLSSVQQEMVDNLDSALKKMPTYKGNLTRSVYFDTKQDIDDFVAGYKVGVVKVFHEYISTTYGENYNPKAPIQIHISNATKGRDISMYNNLEKEVLYERNSEFRVISIDAEDDIIIIDLIEG